MLCIKLYHIVSFKYLKGKNYLVTLRNKAEMLDQLQDKTDNVAVIVDDQGETLEDYYDVGNRAMYQNVPDYVNRRNVQVTKMCF